MTRTFDIKKISAFSIIILILVGIYAFYELKYKNNYSDNLEKYNEYVENSNNESNNLNPIEGDNTISKDDKFLNIVDLEFVDNIKNKLNVDIDVLREKLILNYKNNIINMIQSSNTK